MAGDLGLIGHVRAGDGWERVPQGCHYGGGGGGEVSNHSWVGWLGKPTPKRDGAKKYTLGLIQKPIVHKSNA